MSAPLRLATLEDSALIARLNRNVQNWHALHYPEAFFPDPDPAALADHFRQRLAAEGVYCFLAGEPAMGYALCSLQSRALSIFSPPVKRLMVDHIAVEPEARKQGLARALLNRARALAQELHCDEILLDTWAENHEAHAFFAKMGFAPRRMLFHAKP